MELQLYNSLSKKKEKFIPLEKKKVGFYACGPTVYDYAHIGNLRTFLFEDLLKRTLRYQGYSINHIMNITDIGHLTSGEDSGEDKMVRAAKKSGKSVWDIAKFYTGAFKKDLERLNVIFPNKFVRATAHINEQINMIVNLEKNGCTYVVGGNIYFDTSKVKKYGQLGGISSKLRSRTGVDKNKKNPADFVLWFTKSKFQDQEMKWDSPWGKGYPGWHIECSAMATKYLGNQFDIHAGGEDLAHIHHNNEIVQAESATGKSPWVKYWIHGAFLVTDKEKMSKSKGNILTINKLLEKKYDPLDFRYLNLLTHYRKQLMFSWDALDSAKNGREKIVSKVLEIYSDNPSNIVTGKPYLDEFYSAIKNDLNTPIAVSIMLKMLKDSRIKNSEKYSLILEFDKSLGLGLDKLKIGPIPKNILSLAEERENYRKIKDWKSADEVRDKIKKLGYKIGDSASGYTLTK